MAYKVIDTHTESGWHEYRLNGIGASEASSIFGYNPYQSGLELFHKKIGLSPVFERNLKAIYGNATEELSSNLYRCWNGNFNGMIDNYNSKRYMCDIYKFPQYQYVANPEICKSLFVSPDRLRIENKVPVATLEIKQTSFYAKKLYSDGVNPSHIIQNKLQTIMCELPYGEVFTLVERDDAYVRRYERDGFLIDGITEEECFATIDAFWGNILKARAINAQLYEAKRTKDLMLARELMLMLEECEPKVEDNNTLSFEKYVTEFYYENNVRKPQKEIEGTEEMYKVVQGYNLATQNYKEADKTRQMYKNKVLDMCKGSLDFKVKFSGKEYVQVTPTSRGISLKTNIK